VRIRGAGKAYDMSKTNCRWLGFILSVGLVSVASAQNSTVPTVPQSAGPARNQELANYLIQINDILHVYVWKEPEVSQSRVLVRPDGRISIPLVQDLQASGLTAMQLKAKLEEKLKEKIDVPEVTVIVDSIQSYQVYVMGSVGHGGAFSSPIPLTIMQVLANAGGFSEFADKENVRIFRGNLIMRFNYKEYVEGKNLSQNIKLESGDVVEVH
jgi:polysaccharide export outer membrane protein